MPIQKEASTQAFNNFLRTNLKWFPKREITVTDAQLLINDEDEIDRGLTQHLLLKLAFNWYVYSFDLILLLVVGKGNYFGGNKASH